ncbi:hypothetical protein Patl1_23472 [Pistacia atlantica]|uniref:Uncharacterized protein n=1 Tax=Pistacia atlantica TaxID=434234 RepID=A0ACC0ZWA4_9ROSI|nr:hypothetical protein Patl1_23472 [Pistacia atlantica]
MPNVLYMSIILSRFYNIFSFTSIISRLTNSLTENLLLVKIQQYNNIK